jgi:putative copper export protein
VNDLLGPAYVAARWGYYLAVFLVIGASSFAPFSLGRPAPFAARYPEAATALCRRAALLGLLGGLAMVGFGLLRLWLQAGTLQDPGEKLTSDFLNAVLASNWGQGWQRQLAAAVAASLGFAAARRSSRAGWIVAAIAAIGAAITTGMTGHAATAESGRAGWLLDAIHVGAGGIWIGGLGVLLLAGVAACRQLDPAERAGALRLLVGRFSRRAQIAAPLMVGFGAWLAVRYLGWSWPLTLFRSDYGWALAGKLAVVLVVAVLGACNWRYVQPRLEAPGGERRLRRFGAAELGLSVLVLGVTAVLVALSFSEPGR